MSVRLSQKGACLIVHNTDEKRGVLTPQLYEAITGAIQKAESPEIRAVILTGGAFFCAGGDLNRLKTAHELAPAERRVWIEQLHDVIRAMNQSPVPLIAAVEGGAAGAGLSLVVACDLIVAASDAVFTAAYVNAGLTPDGGLTHALGQMMPRQMAMEMCLLGRGISAKRLAEVGMINVLCAPGQALQEALVLGEAMARGPGQAQSRIRRLLNDARAKTLETQLDHEAMFMIEAQGSDEAAEGMAAFLEKRPARFAEPG